MLPQELCLLRRSSPEMLRKIILDTFRPRNHKSRCPIEMGGRGWGRAIHQFEISQYSSGLPISFPDISIRPWQCAVEITICESSQSDEMSFRAAVFLTFCRDLEGSSRALVGTVVWLAAAIGSPTCGMLNSGEVANQ